MIFEGELGEKHDTKIKFQKNLTLSIWNIMLVKFKFMLQTKRVEIVDTKYQYYQVGPMPAATLY